MTSVLALGVVSMVSADPQCVGAVACSLQQGGGDPVDSTVTLASTLPSVSTLEPTTTTTVAPVGYVAIGESVMLGAKDVLTQGGMVVNAKENRGAEGVKNALAQMRDKGYVGQGTTVVVQVGTNSPVSDAELDAIVAQLPPGSAGIVFMTLRANVNWIAGNNQRIAALVQRHPQVRVLDWATESQKIQLCPDGTHITCSKEALNFYANLIFTSVGLATV